MAMLYISTKFCEIISNDISYRVDMIYILKITNGNNSAKHAGGVTVVNLCTSSGHAFYFRALTTLFGNGAGAFRIGNKSAAGIA